MDLDLDLDLDLEWNGGGGCSVAIVTMTMAVAVADARYFTCLLYMRGTTCYKLGELVGGTGGGVGGY